MSTAELYTHTHTHTHQSFTIVFPFPYHFHSTTNLIPIAGMVAYPNNPSTLEAEAGGLPQVPGQPWPHINPSPVWVIVWDPSFKKSKQVHLVYFEDSSRHTVSEESLSLWDFKSTSKVCPLVSGDLISTFLFSPVPSSGALENIIACGFLLHVAFCRLAQGFPVWVHQQRVSHWRQGN